MSRPVVAVGDAAGVPASGPAWGLVSAASAPILLIGGWSIAARLQGDGFDPLSETISALAALDADQRWVMTAALTGVGLAHLSTALALRPAARAGRAILGVGGAATLLVAAFPLPADDGSSSAHGLVAGVAFVSLAIWPAVSWRRRRQHPDGSAQPDPPPATPLPFRPAVALGASAALLALLGWFFVELLGGGDRVGLSERVAAGSQALWPLAAVLLARGRR